MLDNVHRFVLPNAAEPSRLVPLHSLENSDLTYTAAAVGGTPGPLVTHLWSDDVWRSSRPAVAQDKNTGLRHSEAWVALVEQSRCGQAASSQGDVDK